ncbi:MAG TPA: hypothetical protein VIK33_17270 [Anaerolineae bacterium]
MPYTPPARITVKAQPYLNLRREPIVKPGNVIAQLADRSTWPVLGVARDKFAADSNVLWTQIEFIDTSSGQKMPGFCRSDFFDPKPAALPARLQVLPLDGLNLRSSPIFNPAVKNKIVTLPSRSVVQVLGGVWENFDPRAGKWWWLVDFNGQRGYAYSLYLGEATQAEPDTGARPGGGSTTGPEVGRPSPAWKPGVCLAGVGNSDQNTWHEPSFQDAIGASRVEAIKFVPLNDTAKMSRIYQWLRSQNFAFVMVRLTWKPDPAWVNLSKADRMAAAVQTFVDTTRGQLEFAYDNGVRYFEVHNEPNITANPTDPVGDGLGTAWLGPGDFAEWFSRVTDQLRQVRDDVYLGFPGLSPQSTDFPVFNGQEVTANGQRLKWNTDFWLSVCKTVIDEKADWIGVHCYWQAEGMGQYGLENPDSGGMYWRRYKARFPGKLLFITEFSNNGSQVPPEVKGPQYAKYIAMLRNEKAIGAAFAYSVYWADDPYGERWVSSSEEGKFRINELPGAMGAALQANQLTASRVTVPASEAWA